MYRFSTYKQQYKANLKLALPVVMTQLGQILVQVADNVMVGRYGGDDPTPLAATSFGGSVFFILFIAGVGIALGLTPLIGELYAQGDRHKSSQYLQNGVMFYTLLGFLVCGLQLAVIPLMYHMGQPVEVVDMAIPYYKLLAYSMPFIMLFFTFKQFLEGVGNTRVEMVVVILCNLMNVGLNWIFIYGHLGFEELGATGAGLGTLRIAHRHADHDYRLFLQKTEIPRLSSGILAPQLFGQNDPHIAAYGPSNLPADVSRSLGLRRHQYHDGLAEQDGHQRQPDRHDPGQLRLHDRNFDRCRHDHPHLPLLRRPQAEGA